MDPSIRPSTQTLPCGRPARCFDESKPGAPATAAQLSHAIVTVLTREQEDFIETLTKDVWQLEQRLTGGNVGDPEIPQRAVSCPPRPSCRAHYGRPKWRDLPQHDHPHRHLPDGRQLVADTAQQFDRVRSLADGETEYLHGVIEFYQTVLSVKSTLLGQAQNEKVQLAARPATPRTKKSKRSPPGRRFSCPLP